MNKPGTLRHHALIWLIFGCLFIVDDCPLTSILDANEIQIEETISQEEVDESFALVLLSKVRLRQVGPPRVERTLAYSCDLGGRPVARTQQYLSDQGHPSTRPARLVLGVFQI